MIRVIGAILVLAASTSIGFVLAARYRERPRAIRQWRLALQSMETEILYGLVPVESLAAHLSQRLPQPIAHFFSYLKKGLEDGQPLQTAWRTATLDYWPETAMKASEREIILQFGTTLGTEDAVNQKKHIQLAISHLDAEETEARQEQATYEKMWRSLGFLAGLLIVLIML
ncbi:MAG: stage III sporulation protein SpoIIIAB [Sporolactobacillus sp.]